MAEILQVVFFSIAIITMILILITTFKNMKNLKLEREKLEIQLIRTKKDLINSCFDDLFKGDDE